MASKRRTKCHRTTIKLVWLFGIAFSLILLAEVYELHYGHVVSSLDRPAHETPFVNSWRNNEVTKLAKYSTQENTQQKKLTTTSTLSKIIESKTRTPVISLSHNSTKLNKTRRARNTSLVMKVPDAESLMPEVLTLSEMYNMLLQNGASSFSTTPLNPSASEQELLKAKSLIENTPPFTEDHGLYSPAYRNLSSFIRSYELMEQILKIYIYKDGKKPLFHNPMLLGIYASEGWFLKLLEANKQYVTKNASHAHLFYLPFSSKMLQMELYVPGSHSISNIIQKLEEYVDWIKKKYPFWNRTSGTDHFLVACHDWAPRETRKVMGNCIRALCNADPKIEGFRLGKDVSLPETKVHSTIDPYSGIPKTLRAKRHTLAFFAGQMHGDVRPVLFKHWGKKDSDIKLYTWIHKRIYFIHMKSSKFCLCPRGHEVNSPRVVEAIIWGCVPVIISDNFVPPFMEVLNWEAFAVFVQEKDIPNLKKILLSISERMFTNMQHRVRRVRQHFIWHAIPEKYDIFHMILHSIWHTRLNQMYPS